MELTCILFDMKHYWSWKVSNSTSLLVNKLSILVSSRCNKEVTNIVSCIYCKNTRGTGTAAVSTYFVHFGLADKDDPWIRCPL